VLCLDAATGESDAKRRRVEVVLTSSAPMRSSSVAGNDSSSSDKDDDERSSPASSAYLVASGPEEDLCTPGTRCLQPQLRVGDEGRRELMHVELQNVDIRVANHQDDHCDRNRPSSLLAAPPSASISRTSIAGKSSSGGPDEKSCRSTTMLTTAKMAGGAGASSRADLELLYRLFPHVPPVTLDCVLLSCAGNVVQCIEQLLKFHQLKPSVDIPPLPVGANFAAAAAAAAAYVGLPHAVPTYHHHQQRFVSSPSVEPLAFPVPGVAHSGKSPAAAGSLSLMPAATPFNGTDAMQQVCAGPRALPFGFPYPPAALLPTIAGLRYNYSAMMAAAAMAHASSTTTVATGSAPVPKTTLSSAGATSLPYGLFAGSYKYTGSSSESDK